jgi:Septum formation
LQSELGPEPEDEQPAERADRARKARPLAVAATVVGIIALVGAAVAVLAAVTHGFRPKTVVTYRVPAVFKLRPGDCINSAPNGLSATVLSCATPHDAEVFATFSLAGSSWPGSAVVQEEAGSGCVSRIGGYVNPAFAEAGFAQEYIYPDQSAWQAGVRTVICEVRASSGQLTGSVRKGG